MKYHSAEFQALLSRMYTMLDRIRLTVPILSKEEIRATFEKKLPPLLKIRDQTVFTSATSEVVRDDMYPLQLALGTLLPSSFFSKKDIGLGFFLINVVRTQGGNFQMPIGIVFLPKERYVLHVQGLYLDTSGTLTAYEKDTMKEDAAGLRKLGSFFLFLEELMNEFPVDDSAIGKKNAWARKQALDDLKSTLN